MGETRPTVLNGVIDRGKEKIGISHTEEGISVEFTELKEYGAEFVYAPESPEKVKRGQSFASTVTSLRKANFPASTRQNSTLALNSLHGTAN